MAAGDAFTYTPQEVIPLPPVYNTEQTQSDGMKKEYFELDDTPVERWKLKFKGASGSTWRAVLDHYKDQSGGYHSFSWQTVPAYIDAAQANKTGRWVKGSISQPRPVGPDIWDFEITFEKEN